MKKHLLLILVLFIFGCNKDEEIIIIEKQSSQRVPIISITTENLESISSKNNYLKGTIKISSENKKDNLVTNLKIRGRGNTTWGFPKKPYQIKFDKKESILGMPKDKKWILLANYSDKTMLRNEIAFTLSRFSKLDWTPESRFVELFVNHEYLGLYQITQKVEVTSNRVDIGKHSYLLEVDQLSKIDSTDIFFKTNNYLFNIKEPKLKYGDSQFNSIKDYIVLTEKTLLGDNFTDKDEGYTKYIDVSSFIDWYLINEITKNNDAIFHSSVYLSYIPGEKLKIGPIWDYDISLGNINYNNNESPDGFWIKNAIWYERLFEDPAFVSKVKSRFNHYYNSKDLFFEQIDANSNYIYEAQERNFLKWPILGNYVWPNYVYFSTYDEETTYLKEWLTKRLEWLKVAINEL